MPTSKRTAPPGVKDDEDDNNPAAEHADDNPDNEAHAEPRPQDPLDQGHPGDDSDHIPENES